MYKGINQDVEPNLTDPDQYSFAKNIVLGERFRSIVNEPGTKEILDLAQGSTSDYKIIGVIPLDQAFILFSLNDSVTAGTLDQEEIGIYYNNKYTKIEYPNLTQQPDYGFNVSNPIHGVSTINFKQEIVISWTDGENPPRYLNIGTLDNPKAIRVDDINDTLLFPEIGIADLKPTIVPNDGALAAGNYFIALSYEDTDGTLTSFVQITEPINITNYVRGKLPKGVEPGQQTNTSIELTLNNLDTRFEFARIAIIQIINEGQFVFEYPKISTAISTTLTITGAESWTPIVIDDIVIPLANYSKVKTMTALDNTLYLANLETNENLQYQKYANNIIVDYTYKFVDHDQEDFNTRSAEKGFQHYEVYAFYIRWIYPNGARSQAFHIPGRDSVALNDYDNFGITGQENDVISSPDIEGSGDNPIHYLLETVDNPNVVRQNYAGTPHIPFVNEGTMGFWENQNEFYPDNEEFDGTVDYEGNPLTGGRDVRTNTVKHHRFPSMWWMKQFKMTGLKPSDQYGTKYLSRLGVRLHNVHIPEGVIGYELLYAQRGFNNSVILDQSYLQFAGARSVFSGVMSQYVVDPGPTIFPVGVNAVTFDAKDGGRAVNIPAPDLIRFTGYNAITKQFQTNVDFVHLEYGLNVRPSVGPSLKTDPDSNTGWSEDTGTIGAKLGYWVFDYIEGDNVNSFRIPKRHKMKKTNGQIYVPTNTKIETQFGFIPEGGVTGTTPYVRIDNTVGDLHLLISLEQQNLVSNSKQDFFLYTDDLDSPIRVGNYLDPNFGTDQHYERSDINFSTTDQFEIDSALITLVSYQNSLYSSFNNQTLISTSKVNKSIVSGQIYGGDVFTAEWSAINTAPHSRYHISAKSQPPLTWEHTGQGKKVLQRCLLESVDNLSLRYRSNADPQNILYPHAFPSNYFSRLRAGTDYRAMFDLKDYDIKLDRIIDYTTDYTKLNDFIQSQIFNGTSTSEVVNQYPTRIHKSIEGFEEQRETNWRSFLPNSFYEQPKLRGEIINIEAYGDKIIIHHRHGLYITREIARINNDVSTITLGSGDIFEIRPQEIIPSIGYAGTNQQFGAEVTKVGYIFPDALRGKYFIFGSQLEEISNTGMRQFFRDYLNLVTTTVEASTIDYAPQSLSNGRFKVPTSIGEYDILPENTPGIIAYDNDYYFYLIDFEETAFNSDGTVTFAALKRSYTELENDNPYNNSGFFSTYDEKYNRIIIGKKNTQAICKEEDIVTGECTSYGLPIFVEKIRGFLNMDRTDEATLCFIRSLETGDVVIQNIDGENKYISINRDIKLA